MAKFVKAYRALYDINSKQWDEYLKYKKEHPDYKGVAPECFGVPYMTKDAGYVNVDYIIKYERDKYYDSDNKTSKFIRDNNLVYCTLTDGSFYFCSLNDIEDDK